MGIMGRRPQSEWKTPGIMTSKAATTAVNGALEGARTIDGSGSLDDFSLISSTSTDPDNAAKQTEAMAAKLEGLGISHSTIDSMSFSQTKRSSDDLVASMNQTPSPNALKSGNGHDDQDISAPSTPSPQSRNKNKSTDKLADSENPENTPSPHRIPKYKIALTSNILSAARKASTTSAS